MVTPVIRTEYLRDNPVPAAGPLNLKQIGILLLKHKLAPSRFGRDAVGDPGFVSAIRDGREVRPKTWEKVHAYLDRKGR